MDHLWLFQGRVSLLCVGNELNGDDALGKCLSSQLREADPDLQVIYASTAPENFVGEVIRFKPERVVVVDAGDFGEQPGKIMELPVDSLQDFHFSTHRMPMKHLARRFRQDGIDTAFLAVQAKAMETGQPMSGEVKAACELLAQQIMDARANKD